MSAYKLTNGLTVIRTIDNAYVPFDIMNKDYQDYEVWLGLGNIPDAADPTQSTLPLQAQELLNKSDITILRCVENSVAVPLAWMIYRAALRDIVNGSSTDPLPIQPSYP